MANIHLEVCHIGEYEEKNMVRRQISDNKASPFTVKRYF